MNIHGYKTKQRVPNPTRFYRVKSSTGFTYTAIMPADIERVDITQGHPGPPYRSGGPFMVRRRILEVKPTRNEAIKSTSGTTYTGVYVPSPSPLANTMILPPEIPETTMNFWGAKAWNKFKPGQNLASLGQFIGELKDFPGMIEPFTKAWSRDNFQAIDNMRSFADVARRSGSDYLSVKFGWEPFLRDLAGMFDAATKTSKALAQLKRDNGRTVRRSGTIEFQENSTSSETTGYGYFQPALGDIFANWGMGKKTTQTKTTTRFWFSGAFKYWIPDLPTWEGTARTALSLWGLNPSAATVWELTPWSWLLDYFGNIGDVMSNISGNAAEGLVAPYAFIMGHTRSETTVTVQWQKRGGGDMVCSYKLIDEVKRRSPASPFGFGVDFSDLSAGQVNILSALGLSRF